MKIEFPEIIEFKKEITKLFVSQNVEWRHPNLWIQVTIHSSSSIKNSSKLAVTTDFIYDVPTIFNKKSRSPKNYRAKYITSWQLKNRQKLTPNLVGRWSSCKFSSYLNFFPFSTQNTQLQKIVQNKEKNLIHGKDKKKCSNLKKTQLPGIEEGISAEQNDYNWNCFGIWYPFSSSYVLITCVN